MGTINNNLALLAYDEEEFKTSYVYMKKAISIREKVLPNGHPHLKDSINGLKIIEATLKEQREIEFDIINKREVQNDNTDK